MRGYTPAPLYYFLLAGIPHSAPQARGNTGRLSFRPAVGQAVPAALVSPLTPFPGISAVVLNLLLVYQPQTAQGGIFFSPPQRGKAKKSSSRAGHNPAPRPACKAYSVSGSMSAGRSVLSNSITHTSGFAFQPSVRTLAAGSVLSHSLRNEVM